MKLNSDCTRATLSVDGSFTASQLEELITRLALLRSDMTPPVPQTRPDPLADPDKPILMEHQCALTGWVGYVVDAARARAISRYILERTPDENIDLFGEGNGQRH